MDDDDGHAARREALRRLRDPAELRWLGSVNPASVPLDDLRTGDAVMWSDGTNNIVLFVWDGTCWQKVENQAGPAGATWTATLFDPKEST